MSFHQGQRTVMASKARYVYLMAGRRFGKTRLMIYRMLKEAEKPNSRIWYVAPFKNQAKEIAWLDILNILPREVIKKPKEVELTIEFRNGSTIALKGADRDNLLGPGLDFIGVDEAQDLKEGVWNATLKPMLIGKTGRAMLIGTKRDKNWFRKSWVDASKGEIFGAEAFYFPSWVNTFVAPEEWANEKKSQPAWIWDREFVSDPNAMDGAGANLKYGEFDRRIHVCAPFEIPANWKRFRGIDWGMDHPTVCLWGALDPAGCVVIYDFYSERGKTVEFNASAILGKTGNDAIEATILDVACWHRESDGRSIADKFNQCGLKVISGKKEDKAYSGANTVKSYLRPIQGPPKLKFFPQCEELMRELETVEWNDKVNEDASDSLRYLMGFVNMVSFDVLKAEAAEKPREGFYYKPDGELCYRLSNGNDSSNFDIGYAI